MSEPFDDKMSAKRVFGRISTHSDWAGGEVITPLGIVSVYSEAEHTRFDFVHDGVLHMRNYHRGFSKRSIAAIAYRFAKEIANG